MDGLTVRDVSDAEREAYARDGFVLLKKIYPLPWAEALATQLEDVFEHQPHRAMDQRSVTGGRTEGIRIDMAALASGMRAAMATAVASSGTSTMK